MEEEKKDYEFYKLVCKTDETIFYIGSTCNIINRIRNHKSSCSNINCKDYNAKSYNIIRANGGFDNFKFIIIHNIKNLTQKEAHQREQDFIDLFKPNMNTQNSYVTEEQKKEQKLKDHKNYRDKNREQLLIKEKEYRKQNKEKIAKYMKEYCLEYHDKHKDEIKQKMSEKITCECGCISTKLHLARHRRSIKHINLMNGKEPLLEKRKEKITCECGCIILKIHLERHKQTTKHINLMKNDELQILN